jgi:capsule biosynthesis phosphatase
MKTIIFDIDNTITRTIGTKYDLAKPIKSRIKMINKLYDQGNIIKIFTSRYMGKCNGNIQLIKKKFYNKTVNQLNNWGLKYHNLIMGKPIFDIFVDDKAFNSKDKKLKKILKNCLLKSNTILKK